MSTYSMKVDSCESCPKILAEFPNIPDEQLEAAINAAKRAFRSVEVTDEETGEVVMSYYVGERLVPKSSNYDYGDAIGLVKYYAYDK